MTRVGVVLPQHTADPADLLGAARLAEESGLDSVWLADHFWGLTGIDKPMLEGWTALAAVASTTSRVTVGSLVMRVTLRLPAVLAAMAKTAWSMSPGRLVVGLGVGDETIRDEQAAYGIPFPPVNERLSMLDESIDAIRGETPEVPIWLGGTSKGIAARLDRVDGWNFWGPPAEFAEASRGVSGVEISWAGSYPGTEALARLAREGADHVIIPVGAKNYRDRIPELARANLGYPPRV